MWIPRAEHYYNETVPQEVVHALGNEYENFSLPSADRYEDPYPENAARYDMFSDSLYLIPRLQNYADPLQSYYEWVINQKSGQSNKPPMSAIE